VVVARRISEPREVDKALAVRDADEGCDCSRDSPSRHSWHSSSTLRTSAEGGSALSHVGIGADEGEDVMQDNHGDDLVVLRDNVLPNTLMHDRDDSGEEYVRRPSADLSDTLDVGMEDGG
jgi:hypothetical protein